MMNDIPAIRQAVRGSAYEEALAERLGLNATDLRGLELVLAEPGLSPGRLAEASGLTTGAITGMLDRLESSGFVRRESNSSDRRRVVVQPTQAAAEAGESIRRLDTTIESLLGKRSATERAAIVDFLNAMSSAVAEDTLRLRASARGGFVGKIYTAPVGEVTRARLLYSTGAPRLALNIAPFGPAASARLIAETSASRLRFAGAAAVGDLIRASFDGALPDAKAAAGIVSIRFRRSVLGAFSTRSGDLALATGIPWSIEIDGGITDLRGTLSGVLLDRLEIGGGANHVDLELPPPVGTATIRVNGVASSARFTRPAGVPVALRVDGGISHLRLDGQKVEQVAGGQRFTSAGFAGSEHRYEIEILGGASQVRIGTI